MISFAEHLSVSHGAHVPSPRHDTVSHPHRRYPHRRHTPRPRRFPRSAHPWVPLVALTRFSVSPTPEDNRAGFATQARSGAPTALPAEASAHAPAALAPTQHPTPAPPQLLAPAQLQHPTRHRVTPGPGPSPAPPQHPALAPPRPKSPSPPQHLHPSPRTRPSCPVPRQDLP